MRVREAARQRGSAVDAGDKSSGLGHGHRCMKGARSMPCQFSESLKEGLGLMAQDEAAGGIIKCERPLSSQSLHSWPVCDRNAVYYQRLFENLPKAGC